MPAIIVLLVLLGLAGGVQVSSSDLPEAESEVLVGGQFGNGGLVFDSQEEKVSDTVDDDQEVVEVQLLPQVTTFTPQNIDTDRATLRGELLHASESYSGAIYFIISTSYREVVVQSEDAERVYVSKRSSRSGVLTRNATRLEDDQRYYYRFCFTADGTVCGSVVSFDTNEDFDQNGNYRNVSVTTDRAEDINGETALLSGSYRLNDSENGIAFFVYGEDKSLVSEVSDEYDEYTEIREQDDDLQRVRTGVDIESRGDRTREIDDLETGTEYFFSFCVAYDDEEETAIECGSVRSFETKDRDRDIPLVRVQSDRVSGSSVELTGSLDMQDFVDGLAFLVYGTDVERITEVSDRDEFDDIRQAGDKLQRVLLDTDVDGRETVEYTAKDLTSGAYWYRFCLEYETENDNGRDELQLSCGDPESFEIE